VSKSHISIRLPHSSSYGAVSPLFCDAEGYLYVTSGLRHPRLPIPHVFMGRLPADTLLKPGPKLYYEHFYGSIARFRPEGGEVALNPHGNMAIGVGYGGLKNCTVKGADWIHLGASPTLHRNKDHAACNCERAEPAMDRHDRLFVPDAYRYCVNVIDKNANVLLTIGKYGTWPDETPGTPPKESGIGLGWPICVRVTDTACFVGDKFNHRVVKVKLGYHTTGKVDLRVSR
jgi:hypothetical protein